MFTTEELIGSIEYKEWVTEPVVLIHNTYHDAVEPYQTYIVIQSLGDGLYSITRFFKSGNRIMVSVDHNNVTAENVFSILLTDYSRGLI